MEQGAAQTEQSMHVVGNKLILSVGPHPDDGELRQLQKRVLHKMETSPVKRILIDVSLVRVMDSVLFGILAELARMVKLLGGQAVFIGFQAGVASTLVDLDVDLDCISTAVTMEDGMEQLELLAGLARSSQDEPHEADQDEQAAEEPVEQDSAGAI